MGKTCAPARSSIFPLSWVRIASLTDCRCTAGEAIQERRRWLLTTNSTLGIAPGLYQFQGRAVGFSGCFLQGLVRPDTLLVFHNAAYPRLKDCRTTVENAHSPLGQQMHITQLNAASKFVVGNRTRWHFLDYGQMSEATMLDFAHLRDGLHPNSQFLAQAFNIVMNLYREHRLELGQNATG